MLLAQPEFRGSALDYFGIWSTNLLLTILTLGIYFPWAIFRKRKYLYGSTCLLNAPLDYHARPTIRFGRIRVGRLILALLLFVVLLPLLALANFFLLQLSVFLLPLFLFALTTPFLVVLAYRFNLRNTSWRQLRFEFQGRGTSAFIPYLVWPALAIMTFGLLLPYMRFRQLQYTTDNMEFCKQRFHFSGRARTLYKFYILALIAVFLVICAYLFAIADPAYYHWGVSVVFGFIAFFAIPIAVHIAEQRYRYNHTSFGKDIARFSTTMSVAEMLKIHVTNLLAIIFSFGLAIPWATIRMHRYRISCIQVHCESEESIDAMIGEAKQEASAIGAGMRDNG